MSEHGTPVVNLKRYIRALYRLDEAFDGWTPTATVALVVVLALCALNAVAISTAGGAVASHVSGTVTVDNPNRPPDWVRNDNSTDPVEVAVTPRRAYRNRSDPLHGIHSGRSH